ncbi:MAG: sialidase family protein [Spirosomataceae bacterium]
MHKLLGIALLGLSTCQALAQVKLLTTGWVNNPPNKKECHASTIVELGKDSFLTAWFAGSHEKNPDVCIWTSRSKNGQWEAPVQVADGVVSASLRYPCWNPVLFKNKAGKLFLFYKVGKNPREWWGMMKTSDDDGEHWSAAVRLPDGILGPIKNKPIQLDSGELLCPSSTESVQGNRWNIHIEKADASGSHWKKITIECDSFGVIQPTVLVHPSGRLQLLCRSRQNHVIETWSSNKGETWTKLSMISLQNPNSGIDGVTLHNGQHLLVYNPTQSGGNHWSNGRNKLAVALSSDGQHWNESPLLLEDEAQGEFSYPAVIQDEQGRVHVTYTYNRKMIKHVVLQVE